MPGNSKSLWHAVKIAKNIGHSTIPNNMTLNNGPVTGHDIPQHFPEFFDKKVSDIVSSTAVNLVSIYRQSPIFSTVTKKLF